jgi:STE24 endopeptidase
MTPSRSSEPPGNGFRNTRAATRIEEFWATDASTAIRFPAALRYLLAAVGRFLPLIPVLLWMIWLDEPAPDRRADWTEPAVAFAMPVMLTLALLGWSRLVASSPTTQRLVRRSRRFHRGLTIARWFNVVWLGVLLFGGGWGTWVLGVLEPVRPDVFRLPGILLGTLPVLVGWVGLTVAGYAVDRRNSEQNLLVLHDNDRPIYAPPGPWRYVWSAIRGQILFTLVPILGVLLIRDLAAGVLHLLNRPMTEMIELAVFVASLMFAFIFAPMLMVRVLGARPLAAGELRDRLEAFSKLLRADCRDILVWDTNFSLGNALVMGVVPRFRYVLLSDLLLESMPTRQIEAVFAHEAGHIRHRHLIWYVLFLVAGLFALYGPATTLYRLLLKLSVPPWLPLDVMLTLAMLGFGLMLFGMLSRLFERQADLFAARSIELLESGNTTLSPLQVAAGPSGARAINGALLRVAELNHFTVRPPAFRASWVRRGVDRLLGTLNNFLHPSIAERIAHVDWIAQAPVLTERFDRRVTAIRFGMISLLLVLSAWALLMWLKPWI